MLTFTDRANEMIRSFIEQSGGELEALRVSVDGSPLAPRFDLTLVGDGERREDERVFDADGFRCFIGETHVARLEGATVDFVDRVNESGFEVRPRADALASAPAKAPAGPMADKVTRVLEEQINPAIAAHGGAISLVDVQDTEIYVEMTGGCQGCAMSRLTLRQGVERMLRQSVPEITAVHDVTDHDEGENPYYDRPL